MTIEFRNRDGEYVKQWINWDGIVPIVGDTVILHYGDYNEIEESYEVEERDICGDNSNKIILYIN